MIGFLLALAAFSATLAGGLFALKFRDGMHFILAFTAGVLLGVVSFDILPEVFGLAHQQGLDATRSEEHTSELQSRPHLVCRLLLEKKKKFILMMTTRQTSEPTFLTYRC